MRINGYTRARPGLRAHYFWRVTRSYRANNNQTVNWNYSEMHLNSMCIFLTVKQTSQLTHLLWFLRLVLDLEIVSFGEYNLQVFIKPRIILLLSIILCSSRTYLGIQQSEKERSGNIFFSKICLAISCQFCVRLVLATYPRFSLLRSGGCWDLPDKNYLLTYFDVTN